MDWTDGPKVVDVRGKTQVKVCLNRLRTKLPTELELDPLRNPYSRLWNLAHRH